MAKQDRAEFNVGQPAPDRERVSRRALYTGLFLAPLAWFVQLVVGFELSGRVCFTPAMPDNSPATVPVWFDIVLAATNILALVTACVALLVAIRCLRHTGTRQHPPGSGGMMHVGQGRSRFLAVFGLTTSLLFLAAIAFNTASLYLVPLCA